MKKKYKKVFITILIISLLIIFSFTLKNYEGIIKSIHNYKIKQAINSGDFIKAEKFYKRNNSFAQDKISKQFVMNDFIKFYTTQKLYNHAINLYLEKINSGIYCPTSNCGLFTKIESDKAATYNEISFLYFKTGNFRKAEEYIDKAINSLNKLPEKNMDIKNLSASYNLLAYIEINKGNFLKAKEYLNKTATMLLINDDTVKQEKEILLINYYKTLISYYKAKNNYKEAKIYAEKLFSLTPATDLAPDLSSELYTQGEYLIDFNKILGDIYYETKEYTVAQRHYKISYNLSNELNGQYHPDTICSKCYLTKIYKNNNREELSKRYINEIKNEVKGYKLLKDINNDNFEKELSNFCN